MASDATRAVERSFLNRLSQRRMTFDAENYQKNKRKTLRVSGVGFRLLREMTVSVHN
jgi:hypothetical protein